MKERLKPYLPGILLFVIFLAISIFTFKDYGISWDEPAQREIGNVCYDYITNQSKTFETFTNKEYGVAFELPLIYMEGWLGLKDSRDIYLMRHFTSHLFFLFAALCAYVLCYKLFRSRFVASLGLLMLVCNPRLYAHSFFNTKDIPLLCAVLICFTVARIAFEKDKTALYLLLAFACAYATAIRITAILLPMMISIFLIIDLGSAIVQKKKPKYRAINFFVFVLMFSGFLYLLWPALWGDPFNNFAIAYTKFSHFTNWDFGVHFMGKTTRASLLPWYYIPFWFLITTPEIWLLAALTGTAWILVTFIKRPGYYLSNSSGRNFLLYGACFFAPLAAVIVLHPIVYDDWRHFYFIYASFIPLALFGINKGLQSKFRPLIQVLCIAQLALVAAFMFLNHPLQQVYFNNLVSHKDEELRKKYELDYWGSSYKYAIDYVLAKDKRTKIRVGIPFPFPPENVSGMLPASQRDRVQIAGENDTVDYFITTFRNHPADYPYANVFYNVKVLNSSVIRVYKRN